jgi:peptidoglycan/xylan/chitin deacetylase (PgdA/CDA1 family)
MLGGHINQHGNVGSPANMPSVVVDRHDMRSAAISFSYGAIGLHPGEFRWRVLSGWDDPSCVPEPGEQERRPCNDRAPNHLYYHRDIIRPHVVGCTRDEDVLNLRGSGRRREIALTFDDGPSSYTGHVIDILNHTHVHSTFFLIGQNVGGHERVMRRALESGHELGNHSMHHETNGASASSLRETNSRIRSATGFTPCLYRPPGGYISGTTTQAAWSQGMSNILWDVDPTDWQTPGSGAIYSRVVSHAHAGSIVLLHDGGGNRSQTVAALPNIIHTLKGRGYDLVTVSHLLGEKNRWVP